MQALQTIGLYGGLFVGGCVLGAGGLALRNYIKNRYALPIDPIVLQLRPGYQESKSNTLGSRVSTAHFTYDFDRRINKGMVTYVPVTRIARHTKDGFFQPTQGTRDFTIEGHLEPGSDEAQELLYGILRV